MSQDPIAPTLVAADRLRRACDLARAAPVAGAAPSGEAIGQARALEAASLAGDMRLPGYNLFVMGPSGSVAKRIVGALLRERAAAAPAPSDWVYVNNFDEPNRPRAIAFPPGRAVAFRDAMLDLIEDLRASLPAVFESDEYRSRREAVEEEVRADNEAAFEALASEARDKGAAIVRTPMGFAVAPLREGQVLGPEEFRALPDAERAATEKAVAEIQERLQALMRQMPAQEKARREAIRKLDRETAEMAVAHSIEEVEARFGDVAGVRAYLASARKTLVEHAQLFLASPQEQTGAISGPSRGDGRFEAFSVNVVVGRRDGEAPAGVVTEDHPTMMNLIGRIEHVAQQGALLTNFTLIKPGALHRANGGYLLLDARQVLSQAFAWQALKRSLRAGEIRIVSPTEYTGFAGTVSLEPDAIPLDLKVVIFGERLHYYLLLALDPDTRELFKVVADFEEIAPRTPETERDMAALFEEVARRDGLPALARDGAEAMVEHAARLAEDAERLSLDLDRLSDRLREAGRGCRAAGRAEIGRADVEAALRAEERRVGRVRERAQESILRDIALIETKGSAVGQINGLAVSRIGDLSFGRPSRITARVRLGAGKVVDIEREVELGGPLHSKGVLILSGFLSARYALDAPMSLAATLVFEQSYAGVDGDSASCAELCALLSALSETPLRQDLAITGSVNQYGQAQAIGGVNDKVEGFFDICAARGLTGSQGVIIPASNAQHLMLREDVVAACREGRFAVHAVTSVDEALALLTGEPAGTRGADGLFEKGSVNRLVEDRLRDFARMRRDFAAEAGPGGGGAAHAEGAP